MPEAMNRSPSSSALLSVTRDSDTASVRPRNRRFLSAQGDAESSSTVSSSNPSRTPSRGTTPIPAAHIGSVTGRNDSGTPTVRSPARSQSSGPARGLLDSSWTPSWSSVQELASSLLSGGDLQQTRSRNGSRTRGPTRQASFRNDYGNNNWGPAPPAEDRPRPNDIAAGSLAKRGADLKAMRTASVLESHEGVNGGLDIMGKFKKRSSDEDLRGTAQSQETEEYLAYIHHVQKTDTYAGIVLRYRCQEDAFRKANGLWSRDNIQVRKWLALPVEACEVRGRPCDPPTSPSSKVDLLSKTPDATDPFGRDDQRAQDDFFTSSTNGHTSDQAKTGDDDSPWTHVRWVSIDSCPHPVEVARVPRRTLGYFPPRRKKSIHTTSTLSTPRASADLPSVTVSEPAIESPRSTSSRRPSLLASRSPRGGASNPPTSRNRVGSAGSTGSNPDSRPAWMRRPGGVGSMGRHVRAPGPDKDYFNTWTNKHLPGLNIDFLPSMSVMGSESARFGFSKPDDNPSSSAAIVESPFEEGRDAMSTSRQGSGLDKAAAAVETWLRGAFERAKQGPLTPVLGPRGRPGPGSGAPAEVAGDLIELADTTSDDGRHEGPAAAWEMGGLAGSLSDSVPGPVGGTGRSPGPGAAGVRGRGSKKAD